MLGKLVDWLKGESGSRTAGLRWRLVVTLAALGAAGYHFRQTLGEWWSGVLAKAAAVGFQPEPERISVGVAIVLLGLIWLTFLRRYWRWGGLFSQTREEKREARRLEKEAKKQARLEKRALRKQRWARRGRALTHFLPVIALSSVAAIIILFTVRCGMAISVDYPNVVVPFDDLATEKREGERIAHAQVDRSRISLVFQSPDGKVSRMQTIQFAQVAPEHPSFWQNYCDAKPELVGDKIIFKSAVSLTAILFVALVVLSMVALGLCVAGWSCSIQDFRDNF